jgi:hypothetical protein
VEPELMGPVPVESSEFEPLWDELAFDPEWVEEEEGSKTVPED